MRLSVSHSFETFALVWDLRVSQQSYCPFYWPRSVFTLMQVVFAILQRCVGPILHSLRSTVEMRADLCRLLPGSNNPALPALVAAGRNSGKSEAADAAAPDHLRDANSPFAP